MAMMLVRRVAQRALVLASESRGAGVGSMRTFAAQSGDSGSDDDANPDVDTTFNDRKDAWSDRRHCLLYTSPSPRDVEESRMPSSA